MPQLLNTNNAAHIICDVSDNDYGSVVADWKPKLSRGDCLIKLCFCLTMHHLTNYNSGYIANMKVNH